MLFAWILMLPWDLLLLAVMLGHFLLVLQVVCMVLIGWLEVLVFFSEAGTPMRS
jgi:hypothetical protein